MDISNEDFQDPIERIQKKINQTPEKITEMQEEIFRLKTENSKYKEMSKALGFISLWCASLLNGDLEKKETLAELSSLLRLRYLVLWEEDNEKMVPIFQCGSGKKVDLKPLRIGKEIAGSTNVIGKIRIFDIESCSINVKEGFWAKGKSLISIPIKKGKTSYVLEACDFFDGMPLKKNTFELLEILAPWTVLGK